MSSSLDDGIPPVLRGKSPCRPSVFRPENLIREARRQRGIEDGDIPPLCVLDPDGDIVRHLVATGQARKSVNWACYHSDLYEFALGGHRIGIVGCAVGAPYAVIVSEQSFVSGGRFVVSITSSGALAPSVKGAHFVLVERALRDEGTSYNYIEPSDYASADPALIDWAEVALAGAGPKVVRGATWTTDAPYRETEVTIETGRALGLAAIEMECAALYALATAKRLPIVCLAQVTNTMAVRDGDFERGAAGGAHDALALIGALAAAGAAGMVRPDV